MELVHIFVISFLSDLDNIVIYASILKHYSSSLRLIFILAIVLSLTRTFYINILHTLNEVIAMELFSGVILLFIAVKMATEEGDMASTRNSSVPMAFISILSIDFLLSLDSILLVSTVSDTSFLIFIGMISSLFVLFRFSNLLYMILSHFPLIYVVIASFIAYTAVENMMKDELVYDLLLPLAMPLDYLVPMLSKGSAIIILLIGVYVLMRRNRIYTIK
ncbi:TerC family protein [Evansella cellulosilytica]|uniref:Integral membrane protein TerC n=1 Tax=Evansella cellulosilytica (strain ATCC 21833 / DSM 2522 / FERM P-1141 / JCM 9156 / N-4) TaxID=649639 RepID=E6TR99_EVAC2|nr:tellurium resistance protein TerC [Evansella cellulosilytica]ADU30611.1 Integral membrane protein TerC [Evansella cellulosilytica DSM 2522]